MPAIFMIGKTIASVNGIESAMIKPGPDTEADEAHDENDGDRLQQRRHEFGDGAVDGDGLVRDEFRLDADRQVCGNPRHQSLDVCAESKNVTAFSHGDRKPDGRFAIYTK